MYWALATIALGVQNTLLEGNRTEEISLYGDVNQHLLPRVPLPLHSDHSQAHLWADSERIHCSLGPNSWTRMWPDWWVLPLWRLLLPPRWSPRPFLSRRNRCPSLILQWWMTLMETTRWMTRRPPTILPLCRTPTLSPPCRTPPYLTTPTRTPPWTSPVWSPPWWISLWKRVPRPSTPKTSVCPLFLPVSTTRQRTVVATTPPRCILPVYRRCLLICKRMRWRKCTLMIVPLSWVPTQRIVCTIVLNVHPPLPRPRHLFVPWPPPLLHKLFEFPRILALYRLSNKNRVLRLQATVSIRKTLVLPLRRLLRSRIRVWEFKRNQWTRLHTRSRKWFPLVLLFITVILDRNQWYVCLVRVYI